MWKFSRVLLAALLVAASLLVAACATQSSPPATTSATGPSSEEPADAEPTQQAAQPAERKSITIAVATYVLNVAYPWLMMPQAVGYWEDLGYDVRVEPVGASLDAVQQLVGGNADFVQVNSSVVVQVNTKEDIPLRVVHETGVIDWALVVPADSDIQTVEDFKGKNIGVFSLASGGNPLMQAYLAENGVDPESDIEMIPVGFGPQASEALNRGDVDALLLWNSALAQLENMGHEFRYFRSEQWLQMPDFALATQEHLIEDDRQTVIDIVKGINMGIVFSEANPECVVRLQWANWPDTRPAEMEDDAAFAWDLHLLKAQMDVAMQGAYQMHGGEQWGVATPEEYDRLQQFLLDSDQIERSLDSTTYILNDPSFWEAVNDFDHEAVRQQAIECDFDILEQQ